MRVPDQTGSPRRGPRVDGLDHRALRRGGYSLPASSIRTRHRSGQGERERPAGTWGRWAIHRD